MLARRLAGGVLSGTIACFAGCGGAPAPGTPLDVVTTWGEVGSRPGQFSYPRAMDCSDDSLWIVDKQARIQRIDPISGHALGEWQMPEWEMGKPTGITVWNPTPTEGDELIFVPDTHYFRVMVYKASDAKPGVHSVRASTGTAEVGTESVGAESPTPLAKFGEYGEGGGQFIYLTDVAALPGADGTISKLYVSEYGGNDRISVFDVTGDFAAGTAEVTFQRSIGKFGSGPGVEFNRPQSIVLDPSRGWLVVTDACNHRIGVLTLEGALVRWIGSPETSGRGVGQFLYPYGVTLLPDGTAMVCEFGNNRVQRIDLTTGESMGTYGVAGRSAGELSTPWAVTILDGKAYILDSGNNRVQVIKRPGGMFGLGTDAGSGGRGAG